MNQPAAKIAYVVKRYPRFSETFVVNEILAHEAAGLDIELFSLRPPVDTHFQDLISRVRAPLTYLSSGSVKPDELWQTARRGRHCLVGFEAFASELFDACPLDAYCALRLAKHAVTSQITHFHAHFASSATSVVRLASLLSGIPYSVTAHAKDIFHESVDYDDLQKKFADADTVFTVSDFNLGFLTEQFVESAQRFVRLYNGMHIADFPYVEPSQRERHIVAVGRFVEKKGFCDLIEACAILRDQQIDFRCSLVGGGELQMDLEQLIQDLDLESHVQILGPQPQREVKQLVQSASVLAAPCVDGADGNRDGLPTVLLEAMALGTPCVSTDVTGIPEVVKHEATGLLVPQREPAKLAESLLRLMEDSALRCELAKRARSLIEQEFDIEKNSSVQRACFMHPRDRAEVQRKNTPHAMLNVG